MHASSDLTKIVLLSLQPRSKVVLFHNWKKTSWVNLFT